MSLSGPTLPITTRPPAQRWLALLLSLALVFAVAAFGSVFTAPKIATWYAGLAKPPFNPPPWVFGPVWTALYAMMAVAAWRVWASLAPGRSFALALYALQLFLNAIWSPVFFGLERPALALAVILALLAAAAATLAAFWRIDRAAGLLLAPYLLWIAFASVLNAAIVALN